MVEGMNIGGEFQDKPGIIARPVGNDTVLTMVGAAPGPTGPWSYVTGIPNSDSDIPAPPPQYLAVAAWAA